ncbi:MAG: aldo/keto reductase [Clostridiales bacterium]|nr:aldo/keto reductase [Clostridiales bacterium]
MYIPDEHRYEHGGFYRRCGRSGILLPAVSLGLWHNFGAITPFEQQQNVLRAAFDCGITHFNLANNYGPPYGEAEANFGRHMDRDWRPYRDELIISTKAGYDMWPGPYGDHGSRKYLVASLDQSLKRMHLDYVDIFYHHRPDPDTPIEETMGALDYIVRSGRALYAGISNYYDPKQAETAIKTLRALGTPMLIHQPSYSIFNRRVENGLLDTLETEGVGCIAFAPLASGLLAGRYLDGIPSDSRAGHDPRYLKPDSITEDKVDKTRRLNELAQKRGQTLAQMSLKWVLRTPAVTSALIGASRPEQVKENVKAVDGPDFTDEELKLIDGISL